MNNMYMIDTGSLYEEEGMMAETQRVSNGKIKVKIGPDSAVVWKDLKF